MKLLTMITISVLLIFLGAVTLDTEFIGLGMLLITLGAGHWIIWPYWDGYSKEPAPHDCLWINTVRHNHKVRCCIVCGKVRRE